MGVHNARTQGMCLIEIQNRSDSDWITIQIAEELKGEEYYAKDSPKQNCFCDRFDGYFGFSRLRRSTRQAGSGHTRQL